MRVIAGLGNPGSRYEGTRHNAGFDVIARLAAGKPVSEKGGDREIAWVRVTMDAHAPRPLPARPSEDAAPEEIAAWRAAKQAARDATEPGPVVLATPLAFMNRSGPPLVRLLAELGADPSRDLLVVVDDVDLEVNALRMRREGSSGGHRGLESIDEALGERAGKFARLRVGIGRNPPGVPSEDWVLARLTDEDAKPLQKNIERAADAARAWVARGIERAMDEYNRKQTTQE